MGFVVAPSRNPVTQLAWAGLRAGDAPQKLAHPKENVLTSPTFEARTRKFACRRCGYLPPKGGNQFCHRDEGKGLGIKTDVREGWAGCGPHDGLPGCHWLMGTSGKIPKAERRRLEIEYGASNRAEMLAKGLWPKGLPLYEEKQPAARVNTAQRAMKGVAKP